MTTEGGVPNPEQKPIIPAPDISDPTKFDTWLDQYINPQHYDRIGLDAVTNVDGTPLSVAEKIERTKKTLRSYREEVDQIEKSKLKSVVKITPEKITRMIQQYVEDLYSNNS